MYLCLLDQRGEVLVHRKMKTALDPCLQTIAPYREGIVVVVECLFPWYGLAARGANQGIPLVRGQTLSLQAIHGGKATNDQSDSQQRAALLRGGLLPQASVYPAEMRATRALRRRRRPLTPKHAKLLAHVPHTHRPSNLPAIGKKIASQATRAGGAARFAAPAVPKSSAGDLALLTYDAELLREGELPILQTARPHDAHTLYLLQTVPGIGTILRLVVR